MIRDLYTPILSHTQLVCGEYLFEVEVSVLKWLKHYYGSPDISLNHCGDLLYDVVVDGVARCWMSIKYIEEVCNV